MDAHAPRPTQPAHLAGSVAAASDTPASTPDGEESRSRAPKWTPAELAQLYQRSAVDPALALGWGRGTQYTKRRAAFFDAIGEAVSAQSMHVRSGKACHKRLIDTLGPIRKAARAALATGVDYDTALSQALKEGQEPLGILLHQDLLKDQGFDTLAGACGACGWLPGPLLWNATWLTPCCVSQAHQWSSVQGPLLPFPTWGPAKWVHPSFCSKRSPPRPVWTDMMVRILGWEAVSLVVVRSDSMSLPSPGSTCSSQEAAPILLLPKEEPLSPDMDRTDGEHLRVGGAG